MILISVFMVFLEHYLILMIPIIEIEYYKKIKKIFVYVVAVLLSCNYEVGKSGRLCIKIPLI
jgi:hypothetical protein